MKTAGQCTVTFLFTYLTLSIELPYALVFSVVDVLLDLGRHRRGPVYIPGRMTHELYSSVLTALSVVAALSQILKMLDLLDLSLTSILVLGLYIGLKHWLLDIAVVPGAYLCGRLLYLTVLRDESWLSTTTCLIATLLLYAKHQSMWLLLIILPSSLEPTVYLPVLAILYIVDMLLGNLLGIQLLSGY